MKLIPTAIAAVVLSAGLAFAATTATGVVKSWDAKTQTMTLQDGTTYILKAYHKASTFKAGEKLKITFVLKKGEKVATHVVVNK